VEDVQVRDSADRESSRRCDQGAALIGGVAAGAYIGGAGVATTAARWGPKAAAGHAVAQKAAARGSNSDEDSGTPSYRRTENDPGSY